jgi:hypothetical protein
MQSLPLSSGPELETAARQSTTIKCPVGTTFHFGPVFGPFLRYSVDFPSLHAALKFYFPRGPDNYDDALDHLLLNGHSFIVVETPELLRVFSKTAKISTSNPKVQRLLFEHFGIPRHMKAVWQPKSQGPSRLVKFADLFVNTDPSDF